MGGTNEVSVTPAPSANKSVALGVSKLRIHQNNGEVHLHDDANGRKFACAVADFYSWWKDGKTRSFSPALVMLGNDGKGNPLTAKFEQSIVGGKVDVSVSFEAVSFGDTVNKIDNFVAGN